MTKIWIMCLALFVCTSSLKAQYNDTLSIGDDIKVFWQNNNKEFTRTANCIVINEWKESEYRVLESVNVSEMRVLYSPFIEAPVGIIIEKNNNFIFDMDGDGLLDYVSNTLELPFWLVKPGITGNGSRGIQDILRRYIVVFQSDIGITPTNSDYNELIYILKQVVSDESFPDRDLVFKLISYFNYINNIPNLALVYINQLNMDYRARYNIFNPMLLQFLCEAAIRNEKTEIAQSVLPLLLGLQPDFIPAKVIQYRIEIDSTIKNTQLKSLKDKYPKHWMVIGL